ncbi:MAG: alpha/beta hydrolase, partial [Chthoniobacteraceae bacterium]
YALACAWGLPDVLEGASVVCGAPPLAELGSAHGFNFVYRTMLGSYRRLPWLVRGAFRMMRPFARLNPPEWMMTALRGALVRPDAETLADPAIAQMCSDGFRAAWGDYRDGVFEDAELYTQPWGFPLEEIQVPVSVWHGTDDGNFSHLLADYAKRIPTGKTRIVEGEGHYSLPIRRAPEILADLVATPARV